LKSKWIAALALILAVAAAAWLLLDKQVGVTHDATPDVVRVEPEIAQTPPEATSAKEPGPQASERSSHGPSPGMVLLQVVGDGHAFDPSNPSNEATSAEDAAWLHRYGIPDPDAYDRLRKASKAELEQAAELDLRAQVVLAFNMAASGRYGSEPFQLLEDATLKGSIFALVTWGDIHFAIRQYRDPSLGAA